jgi:hypothetical protein
MAWLLDGEESAFLAGKGPRFPAGGLHSAPAKYCAKARPPCAKESAALFCNGRRNCPIAGGQQPFNRGFIALTQALDAACAAFEVFLTAESAI